MALQEGGPAKTGLSVGDLIEKLDTEQVEDASALAEALARHRPGETIAVSVLALDGTARTTKVTVGQLPGS
jgi:S1-C subfamily serine protease